MTIAVGERSAGLDGAETIFIADSNHGAGETDGPHLWVSMEWTRPHRLSVVYGEKARLFKSEATAKWASIAYRAGARLNLPPVS